MFGRGGIFLHNQKPIIYNVLLLTGVNLLLRFTSTSFQVYLSGKIGAEGIGLLQLILSVGSLAFTIGMAGIRTATMYLCAEVVGQKKVSSLGWVISGCIVYSVCISLSVAFLLYQFAPLIAKMWIGAQESIHAIRLLAGFLPVSCLCGVMIGYYTGVNKILTLTGVEICEQACSMCVSIILLILWSGKNALRACQAVIIGSGIGGCITLILLVLIKYRQREVLGPQIQVKRKLWDIAVPLAIADTTKAGISTTENLIVPKRLRLYAGETSPLAAFGIVCGMVFPVLMFPAAILYGLAELLIPEISRCNAAGSYKRILYLTRKSLRLTLLYGFLCGGVLYLSADRLCAKLYHEVQAGQYLKWYALLAPMLYCDVIVDAITKGLGKQKICVRNNIITSAMDVTMLFILLPQYGMKGYFISFFLSHITNFMLSIGILSKSIYSTQKQSI